MTHDTLEKDGDHTADFTHPEKIGESTKEVPYERQQTISNPQTLEGMSEPLRGVWIIEYYDRFQNYQPDSSAQVHKDPEKAAEELRRLSRSRPNTSYRAVRVRQDEVSH